MFSAIIYQSQPRVMYLYLALQMLESFAYFGLNFLLVLYIADELQLEYALAFSIFAVYIALTEGLGILGGRFVDKFLGLYYGIYAGATIMFFGYLCISILDAQALYLGLSAIAIGKGMYNPSLAALLGECYHKGDLRRDAGFTYFYVSLNVGACMATALGGYLASTYGWQYIFVVFACSMMLIILLLYAFKKLVPKEEIFISFSSAIKVLLSIAVSLAVLYLFIYYHSKTIYFLSLLAFSMLLWLYFLGRKQSDEHRVMMNVLIAAILILAVFYSFQWQINLSLMEFADKFVSTEFFGIHDIEIISLLLLNPLAVVIFGPFIGLVTEMYEMKKHHEANLLMKMSLGFLIIGLAYAVLHFASNDESYTAAEMMALVFLLIGIAELFVDPSVFAYASEVAPKHMHATVMGAVMLGFSISGLGSGFIATFIAYSAAASNSIADYSARFEDISLTCIAITTSLVITRLIKVYWLARRAKQNKSSY